MPYISVTYPSSTRPYTFYTSNPGIKSGDTVLVKDKNGFFLCTSINYVKKPSFPCNVVIMSKEEMEEEITSQLWEMENEEEEEDDDVDPLDFSGDNDHA